MSFLLGIFGKAKIYLAAVGGALLAVAAAFIYGLHRGTQDGAAKTAATAASKALSDATAASKAAAATAKLPDGAAQTELNKEWARD